jgi:hypothetical protein
MSPASDFGSELTESEHGQVGDFEQSSGQTAIVSYCGGFEVATHLRSRFPDAMMHKSLAGSLPPLEPICTAPVLLRAKEACRAPRKEDATGAAAVEVAPWAISSRAGDTRSAPGVARALGARSNGRL